MRLIDADELFYKLVNTDPNTPLRFCDGVAKAMEFILNEPTIDAVEVIRCKDCKYWQDNNGGYPHEECRWGKDETPDGYDFCSYGERRYTDET